MFQNQGVNKIMLLGQVYGLPVWKQIGSDHFLCVKLVTTESFNKNGVLQSHNEYHCLHIPEDACRNYTEDINEGFGLFVEGKLSTHVNIDDAGVKRYNTSILVSKYSVTTKAQIGHTITT